MSRSVSGCKCYEAINGLNSNASPTSSTTLLYRAVGELYPAASGNIWQYPAVSCSILQYPAVSGSIRKHPAVSDSIQQYPVVSGKLR